MDDLQILIQKAQKILKETDGAILTFQEKKDGRTKTNTMVNSPDNLMDILQMFRSNFLACKEALESLDDKDVKRYGADNLLFTVIHMQEPENLRKVYLANLGGKNGKNNN